jgi:hypothetical protein
MSGRRRSSRNTIGINNGNSRHAQTAREQARELLFSFPSQPGSIADSITVYENEIERKRAELADLQETNPGLAQVTEGMIARFAEKVEQLRALLPPVEEGK